MKRLNYTPFWLFIFFSALFLSSTGSFAQCKLLMKVDGSPVIVNPTDAVGVTLPYWLKPNQTLAISASISSISVEEYIQNNTVLEFSQILTVVSSSPQTVPVGKLWKIVSVRSNNSNSSQSKTIKYQTPGNYTFVVPACAEQVCIEVWGGGGAGGSTQASGTTYGGGGGGGGYGSQCFTVVPGSTLAVGVGSGGTPVSLSNGTSGGTSSVTGSNVSISATGGIGGFASTNGATGGAGGTSAAPFNVSGSPGLTSVAAYGGAGGQGGSGSDVGNGGNQQNSNAAGNNGGTPSGGGSGANTTSSTPKLGGTGGNGQVIIGW